MQTLGRMPLGAAAVLLAGFPLIGGVARPPGAVNYLEGQVSLDGRALSPEAAPTTALQPGDILETRQGKAELLLASGVFVRLPAHSAVRMLAVSGADVRLQLVRGEALVEALAFPKQSHLEVIDGDATIEPLEGSLYLLNADVPGLVVYDGKVRVRNKGHSLTVEKNRRLPLLPNSPDRLEEVWPGEAISTQS